MRVNKSTKGDWAGWELRLTDWEAKQMQIRAWVGRNKKTPQENKRVGTLLPHFPNYSFS